MIGTPIYMAPEQLRGERVSPAADIFALGVIAYEMCTGGFLPYQYEESRSAYLELPVTEIYYRQRTAPPYDPRRRCAALDDAWVNVLYSALAADPRARPDSVRTFALALAEAVPAAEVAPAGLAIVHQVARELTQRRPSNPRMPSGGDVVRTAYDGQDPLAGERARPDSRVVTSPQTAVLTPPSTLAGAASQSTVVASGRARPRWGFIAGCSGAALVAGAAVAFALGGLAVPAGSQPSEASPPAAASAAGTASAKTEEPSHEMAHGAPVIQMPGRSGATPTTVAPAAQPWAEPGAPAAPHAAVAPGGEPKKASRTMPSPVRPPPAIRRTGELAIIVTPWALIWLNGRSLGQTPFREHVPAGRYRLRLANDDIDKEETTFITVTPDQTTTVQRTWR